MSSNSSQPLAPPRLLAGVTLLFWGGVTGHPLMGLVCAFLIEAGSWTDLRWDFGERGFVRAWALSIVMGTLTLAWFWLQGTSEVLLFDLLVWMPIYLLPVILTQNYATQSSMPLNTFSFIARRKMLIDRAAGRGVDPIQIHVGYPYICLVLVAAALSRINEVAFFIALMFLASCLLVFASPVSRKRPVGMVVALLLVTLVGGGGSVGLVALWSSLEGIFTPRPGAYTSGDRSQTAIGQLGMIKQSKRIFWRVRDTEAGGPRLFREAVYNHYSPGQWWHKPVEDREAKDDGDKPSEMLKREDDYDDMWDRELPDGRRQFAFEPAEFDRDPSLRRKLSVIGKVRTKTPLPLPDTTQRLAGLWVTDGAVTANSLGTARLENPDHSVVSFEVFCGGRPLYEALPDRALDLQLPMVKISRDKWAPSSDLVSIREVCDEWGLRGVSAQEAVLIIKRRFAEEFFYSMYLRYQHATGDSSAIADFLDKENREGHCEYFATAAVLLLREAGIPARYCVGFSGQERSNSGEWILRGSHAHAWCRVWHGEIPPERIPEGVDPASYGRWEDFDATPPDWLRFEGSGIKWNQKVVDWWQSHREDFLIWRTAPGNTDVVNRVMLIVGVLLVSYISVRLWQSRTRRGRERPGARGVALGIVTPLHALAKPAEHWLGSRQESQSFTAWILGLADPIPEMEPDLQRAVCFHWKARFDPIGLDPSEVGEFDALCGELKVHLKEARRSERSGQAGGSISEPDPSEKLEGPLSKYD